MEHGMLWLEYSDWMEFFRLEPWGIEVEDDRWTKLINAVYAAGAMGQFDPVSRQQLFPRNPKDWEEGKGQSEQQNLAFQLHDALLDHNARLAAKEGEQPPSP